MQVLVDLRIPLPGAQMEVGLQSDWAEASMPTAQPGDWKYIQRVEWDENGRAIRYKIHFYRRSSSREWYDEVRYDSHELKGGQDVCAPHFHMKLKSAFKADDQIAIDEIRLIIDNYLKEIEGVLGQ